MEKQELTTITNQYLSYWKQFILPMEEREEPRYLHFTKLLTTVGEHLYGMDFVFHFNLAVLRELTHVPSEPATDSVR